MASLIWGSGKWGTDGWSSAAGADTTAPSVPASLAATAISSTRIDLGWLASTDDTAVIGYTIYRGGVSIATVGGSTLSYSDTTVSPSTTYTYAVDAFDAAGNHSAQSIPSSATTPAAAGDTTAPTTPTGLSATAVGTSRVNLSWSASSDNVAVTGYTIYRNSVALTSVGGSALSYADTAVLPGTTYTYAVDAFDAAGNHSAQSSTASATTGSGISTAPGWVRLARTSSLGTAYTDQQVYAQMLRSGQETYVFDWLSQERNYLGDLTPYVVTDAIPQLQYDSTQAVPRSLSFRTLGKPAKLNPLIDLVRVHYRLLAPDSGWWDWVIGTLALSQPRKTITEGHSLYDWTAADLTDWLVKDKFTQSFSLAGGTDAIAGVKAILAGFSGPAFAILIPGSNRALNLHDSISWDAGKSRLEAINDVLAAVSYRAIWPDEMADLRSMEVPDYNNELAPWTWDAISGNSVVLSTSSGLIEEPNETNAPNYCEVIGEDPRQNANGTPTPIFASYENDRPESPISTANLGRRIVKIVQDSKIADQLSAQIRAKAEVQAGAQIFGQFTVPTLPWPAWADGGYPLIHLPYAAADEGVVDATNLVLSWQWPLVPGEAMTHSLQRVVRV